MDQIDVTSLPHLLVNFSPDALQYRSLSHVTAHQLPAQNGVREQSCNPSSLVLKTSHPASCWGGIYIALLVPLLSECTGAPLNSTRKNINDCRKRSHCSSILSGLEDYFLWHRSARKTSAFSMSSSTPGITVLGASNMPCVTSSPAFSPTSLLTLSVKHTNHDS